MKNNIKNFLNNVKKELKKMVKESKPLTVTVSATIKVFGIELVMLNHYPADFLELTNKVGVLEALSENLQFLVFTIHVYDLESVYELKMKNTQIKKYEDLNEKEKALYQLVKLSEEESILIKKTITLLKDHFAPENVKDDEKTGEL